MKKEYKVVVGDVGVVMNDFILEVNTWMKEGWKPQGGIAILDDGNNIYMYQAMVKEVKT